MLKESFLTLLLVCFSPIVLQAHDFYISITSIQHNKESHKLTVKIKVFVNDFEESIFQNEGVRIGLWKDKPIKDAEDYIKKYVFSKFSISINNIPVTLKFVNQTIEPAEVLEDNVLVCQLEGFDISDIRTIKVQNSLITETIDSQINIINIRANGIKKVINLDAKLPEDVIIY